MLQVKHTKTIRGKTVWLLVLTEPLAVIHNNNRMLKCSDYKPKTNPTYKTPIPTNHTVNTTVRLEDARTLPHHLSPTFHQW